jgi:hypothetical protein
MKPARLLRWYPRAWRERYGEELVALIQDTLDAGGHPGWRLRLGVAWGGLRERVYQAGRTVWASRPEGWTIVLLAGQVCTWFPQNLSQAPAAAWGWRGVAAYDAILATAALIGAVVLASGLTAVPALVRFLRAGGWPLIRRRVWCTAGTGAAAAGVLVWLVVASAGHASAGQSVSWADLAGLVAIGLVLAVAIWLGAVTATVIAGHLTFGPRVRAAQLILGAVTQSTVMAVLSVLAFWWSVSQAPGWLAAALANLVLVGWYAWMRLRVATWQQRKLRTAGRARTVNPSAGRDHGRHRA